jgi:hypothetical protein
MNLMPEEPPEDGLAVPTAIMLVVDDEKRSLESPRRVLSIEDEVVCAAEAVFACDLVRANELSALMAINYSARFKSDGRRAGAVFAGGPPIVLRLQARAGDTGEGGPNGLAMGGAQR